MPTVRYKDDPTEYKKQWFKENREKSLAYRRRWRTTNKERLNERAKELRIANKERCRTVRNAWYYKNKDKVFAAVRKWQKKNPDKVKIYSMTSRVKAHYGLSLTEYKKLLSAPCFCGRKATVIDHCHAQRKVRAALCRECNIGIGMFKEDIVLLQKAIRYLKKYQTP